MRSFRMTLEEYRAAEHEQEGRCLNCGAETFPVEPDARKYPCEECEEPTVYGVPELLLMGRIEIV